MYSLPITTYSDYWRATKVWSSYFGGLIVFAAGTRYSTLGAPDITQTLQLPFQLTTQSVNTKKLGNELGFSDSWHRESSQGTVSRGMFILGVVSQGAESPGVPSRGVESPGVPSRGVLSRGVASRGTVSQVVRDRITSRTQVEDKEIPFDTQYVESDKLLPGMSQIQEEGENGIFRQVVKTFEVSGQPVDQQIQSSYELKTPKNEVILRNSKPVPKKKVIISNSKPVKVDHFELENVDISKTLIVEATAYTFTGNKTATGVEPREGLIAVDPKVIAMGSKVYVEGYGYAIAADTGGDICGNRIDVFFSTLRQCINWGRKPVHIYVLNSI